VRKEPENRFQPQSGAATSRRKVSSSSDKSLRNGVTKAVPQPNKSPEHDCHLSNKLPNQSLASRHRLVLFCAPSGKITSANSCSPRLPITHCAAFSAPARESFAAASRMPQRNRIGRRIESNFMRAGNRARAGLRLSPRGRAYPACLISSSKLEQCAGKANLFFGRVMDFPGPGAILGSLVSVYWRTVKTSSCRGSPRHHAPVFSAGK